MTKIIKLSSVVFCSLIFLLIIGIGLLVTFVSPNYFKPIITAQVLKYTGQPLTIDGDLSWSFFPHFGFKTGHLSWGNQVEVNGAVLQVEIWPLLHRQLNVPRFDVDGGRFILANKNAEQIARIDHIQLHAENIQLDKAFPIATTFAFTAKNGTVQGQGSLDAQLQMDLKQQVYQLSHIVFSAKTPSGRLNVKTDILMNLHEQTLTAEKINADVANMALVGTLHITHLLQNPELTGHVNIPPFDLKKWLQAINKDVPDLQVTKNTSGDFYFSVTTSKQWVWNGIHLQGHLNMDELQAAKLKITKLSTEVKLNQGILDLSPVTGALYQGNLRGDAKVNLDRTIPQITTQGSLEHIQAEPLLDDLWGTDKKIKIQGMGTVAFQLNTQGTNTHSLLQSLNGSTQFNFNNGVLSGVNIGYWIDVAHSILAGQSLPSQNADSTSFGNLTGTAIIHNGLLSNNDLFLDSPRFDTKGQGTIDLVSMEINFALQTTLKHLEVTKPLANLYDIPIPINITGNLAEPHVRLNAEAIAKGVAEQQINKVQAKVQEKIQEKLKDKIPEKANELLKNLLQ